MRLALLLGIFILQLSFSNSAYAQAFSPSDFNQDLVRSLSFVFANTYIKDPDPLGVDYSVEVQGSYINNPLDRGDLEEHLWASVISIRKGIYWNLSLNLSFLTPLNEYFQTGFSAGLSHSLDYKWGVLRTSLYFQSYNMEEFISQRGAGLTSILYAKTGGFFTGFGLGFENLTSELQETSSFQEREISLLSYRGLFSILFIKGKNRFSLDGSFFDDKNYLASFSYGVRL